MLRLASIPSAARWLGFGGLIPFAVAAAGSLLLRDPLHAFCLTALLAYGAVILSFLGGVRWGLAISDTEQDGLFVALSVSVVPSLLGWVSLLLPRSPGLVLLALSFAAMLIFDLGSTGAPAWYRRLRVPLSVGAIVSTLIGMFS